MLANFVSSVRCHRSTAKKFLAAANFFEVLQIFPKTDVSESVGLLPNHHPRPLTALQTDSKLKYAKWKAVDIARAFREGRRPTPGPAGSQLDPDLLSDQFLADLEHPPTPPKPVPREPSPPFSRSPKRHSLPPPIPPADIARANRVSLLPGHGKHDNEALSPGCWSTTATPGFDVVGTPGLDGVDGTAGSSDGSNNWHVVDPLTQATSQASSSELGTAWVSTDDEPVEDALLSRGRVRFSLDTPGGSSPPKRASPPFPTQEVSPLARLSDLPPGFVPTGALPYAPAAGSVTFGSPRAGGSSFVMSPPPPVPHSVPMFESVAQPFVSPIASPPTTDPIHVPAYPPPRGVELTPKLMAKAQKHCRFAISALDYEDTQHAIRELKAALETLGVSV
jgi:vacuolar protein sorting-associated protein VTA1